MGVKKEMKKKGSGHVDRLSSGSYRVRKTIDGTTYTRTIDHEPTRKEIDAIINELYNIAKRTSSPGDDDTWGISYNKYIKEKEKDLSPSTVRGYNICRDIIKNEYPRLYRREIKDITPQLVSSVLSSYNSTHEPKGTRNLSGVIMMVIRRVRPTFRNTYRFTDHDSQPLENPGEWDDGEPYLPTRDDVRDILKCVQGTDYYIPFVLMTYGLRRSEVCALRYKCLVTKAEKYYLQIREGKVLSPANIWVIKRPKERESIRDVPIDDKLSQLIVKEGKGKDPAAFVCSLHPSSLQRKLRQVQDKCGLEHFPPHALRHYYASQLHSQGVPEAEILRAGGWSRTSDIMKKVYRQVVKESYGEHMDEYTVVNSELYPE